MLTKRCYYAINLLEERYKRTQNNNSIQHIPQVPEVWMRMQEDSKVDKLKIKTKLTNHDTLIVDFQREDMQTVWEEL